MRMTCCRFRALWLLPLLGGCSPKKTPEKYFYDRQIQPIFQGSCVQNTSPCHRIDERTKVALGNLDLTSYEAVQKRRDVLRTYGSYPLPLLLLKAVPEDTVLIPYGDRHLPSEIVHAGGKPLAQSSEAFSKLRAWLDDGANRMGVAPQPGPAQGTGNCATAVPPGRNIAAVDTSSTAYQLFTADVGPKLANSCAFASCHSSPQSDFYLTCGNDDAQQRFNFLQAAGFVVAAPSAVERSELLLRPLAQDGGGINHTGGTYFPSRTDAGWLAWRAFAQAVQAAPPETMTRTPGQMFFEANVMPKLLQRGCALEGCHSPSGFNDFRLRPGAQGFFAPAALKRNYEATLKEFMALDTVDVRQSRAVKKGLLIGSGGMVHRAGSVLESPGFDVAMGTCPSPFDPMTANAFCVMAEWHRIERQDRGAAVSPMAAGDRLPLAFVLRPPDGDSLLEFDTFRGGADLVVADATLGPRGAVMSVGTPRSVLGSCSGIAGGTADVRGPEWSNDGARLVFAARASAASGLDLWVVDVAGGGACTRLTSDDGRVAGTAGVKVHNFDPVFAPDGSVVFASTRAGTLTLKTFRPNADLYRSGPNADFGRVEQMTWLLNSEIGPAFMQDGRVSFTAEKASPDFYQLAGRRINWDLTDYHPLLAQRAMSTTTFDTMAYPSVGYSQATEIREALDRNFLLILSDVGARGGGGALATFNRSIGPFQADRGEESFLKSVQIVDAAATGKAGTAGVYRSPTSLPNGEILASYAANVTDPAAGTPKYDLAAIDPGTRVRRMLHADASRSAVEATLGYKRVETELYRNLPQLVFGGHIESGRDNAVMHLPDVPLLATLLDANLRRGRNVARFDGAVSLKVYLERPPPSANPGGLQGPEAVYVDRMPLGSAAFADDRSLKVVLPARLPLILELVDAGGNPVFTMREEHQMGPGEYITPGPPRRLFDGICGGCHGSISGSELDVAVTADALTGASISRSRDMEPKSLQ
jgi:hypothetical protein